MRKSMVVAVVCLVGLMAQAAGAQVVNESTARSALFAPRGLDVRFVNTERLSENDRALLPALEREMERSDQVFYYGATALAPDEGFMSNTNQIAANHHSLAAAEAAALAACNAARQSSTPCVVVGHIIPRKYEPGRAIQLGQAATADFRRNYRRGRGPKAFAISPSTGQWGIGKGDGAAEAALSACTNQRGQGGATDCNIIIND
ncbi:5-aminolevulic acid synthase [Aliiroseovarius sp. YM-037]|uniref:5-aminolevulic acid synthase n=1 Tax=Aliiroseovarius sp. YM-037 TaxID=3341728 RepID=UPI003A8007A0